jgi:ribosome biogenesis GTPase A
MVQFDVSQNPDNAKGPFMQTALNWYPGHMKKTREMIQENLKLVDLVLEVVDARIPQSSRNPILDELVRGKERIILLNKSDLADEGACSRWISYFRSQGFDALGINAMRGEGIGVLMQILEKIRLRKNRESQRNKPFRIMIVGVPNCGKSSLINRLTGRKSAQTGDRPGVTRGKQWLTVRTEAPLGTFQLLDTPGILWPKFEDPRVGLNLAFCGSIKDEIMDRETLAMELAGVLAERYPAELSARYNLGDLTDPDTGEPWTPLETMEAVAARRGFLLPGKRIDYERTARTLLDEFRSGAIGRITLEEPPQAPPGTPKETATEPPEAPGE